jgi:hypothetical protein
VINRRLVARRKIQPRATEKIGSKATRRTYSPEQPRRSVARHHEADSLDRSLQNAIAKEVQSGC